MGRCHLPDDFCNKHRPASGAEVPRTAGGKALAWDPEMEGRGGPVGYGYQAVRVFLSRLFSALGHAGQWSRIAVFPGPIPQCGWGKGSQLHRSLETGL